MSTETKTCRTCSKEYSLTTEFFRRMPRAYKDGWDTECKACARAYEKRRAQSFGREKVLENNKAFRTRTREAVITHYGGKCSCCGESRFEFLQVDHIEGRGRQHRKEMKGTHIEQWLKNNNFPLGFRIMCANCNFSLGIYGYCPHHTEAKELLKGIKAL